MKKLFLLLAFMMAMIASVYPRTLISLSGNTPPYPISESATMPTRDVETDEDGNVIVTYGIEYVWFEEDPLYSDCTMVDIDGFGVNMNPGMGGWPLHCDRINVPSGKDATVYVVDAEYKTYDIKLAPARPPLSDSSDESYTTENVPPVEVKNEFLPESCASFIEMSYYRGQTICHVEVHPVTYNSALGITRIYTSITYKVTFTDSSTSKLETTDSTPIEYYVGDGCISFNGDSTGVRVMTLDGRDVPFHAGASSVELPKGIYLIQLPGGMTRKVLIN